MSYPNSAKTGAEVLLEQLECQEVECIFASPIAVMAPAWEALARHGNEMNLRYFRRRLVVVLIGRRVLLLGRSEPQHPPATCSSRSTAHKRELPW